MMRRYGLLFVATLALASSLAMLKGNSHRQASALPAASVPATVELSFEIGSDAMSPALSTVPEGARVVLLIRNASGRAASLKLSGYEDRVSFTGLAPGAARSETFLADRPGEDFAWLLNGEPAGRLNVAGPHLVEGHR